MKILSCRLPLPRILQNRKGFTLAEVIVVSAIVAIISAIAIPQMNNLMNTYRLNGATRLVWADLQNARMTAIKENGRIQVVFTTTQINPTLFTSSYNFIRVNTGEIIFSRNLQSEYPAITAAKTGGGGITFESSGITLNNENATVVAQGSMGSRSIEIKGTGRITIIWL